MSLLLTKSEQGIVVFHIWKNLHYGLRLFLSIALIVAGFALQYQMLNAFPGIILVFTGNLLLLVKGYDNRIKLGTFQHEAEWVSTDQEHLQKVVSLNDKIRKWDISVMDITSPVGALIFMLILIGLAVLAIVNPFRSLDAAIILLTNIAVLIIPHWFTGVKRITTSPALVNKIKIYQTVVNNFQAQLNDDQINYLMLLKGKDKKMPADVKMKLKFKNQPEDFLGFYAQISLNNVQGQDYPYFYVVLVAKKSSQLLSSKVNNLEMPVNVIAEFSEQEDTEILVIRQYTTNKSGYHTNSKAIDVIFETGLETARDLF